MSLINSLSGKPGLHDAAMATLFCMLALIMYRAPLFFGDALYFRDYQFFFGPMKLFLAEMMKHGEWAFWNPRVLMGSPFFADPQSGVLYLPSLLFLFADGPKVIALSLVFHIVVGQMGLYKLARHYQLGWLAAAAGAVVYGLGGWMISMGNILTWVYSAAWAPWVVLVFERLWTAPNLRNTAIAAATIAMQMLAGNPEMFLMIGLVLVVRRLATPGIMAGKWVAYSITAGLLATLIYSPQLLATWEYQKLSVRAAGMSIDELLEFSAIGSQWLSIVVPPALAPENWNILTAFPDGHVPLILSIYVGWAVIALGILGLVKPGRTSLSWLFIIGVGIFLAMGSANPLAIDFLKLVKVFRSPEKYLYLVHIGVALLASFGVACLLSWIRRPRLAQTIGLAILAMLSLDLIMTNGHIDPTVKDYFPALKNSAEVRHITENPGRVYSRSIAADQEETVRGLFAAYRATLTPNIGTIAGISYLNGVPFIALREQAVVHDLIDSQPPGILLARRLGGFSTPYVVTDDPAFGNSHEWTELATRLTNTLWRLKQSAPLLDFPKRVESLAEWETYNAIDQEDYSNGHTVFVPEHASSGISIQEGSVTRFTDRPGHVDANVTTHTGGLLVLRQSAYPGWQVEVDGKEAALIPTNRFFIGVEVPPGDHRVSFRFEPSHWRLGLLLSALGLLTMIVMMIADFRILRQMAISFWRRCGEIYCSFFRGPLK